MDQPLVTLPGVSTCRDRRRDPSCRLVVLGLFGDQGVAGEQQGCTLAAFARAVRVTLVGSMTPALTMSS
jgi:hypothetical protein